VAGNDELEPWFTDKHIHDRKSLIWNETTSNYTNMLVNLDRRTADERGASHLIFNP